MTTDNCTNIDFQNEYFLKLILLTNDLDSSTLQITLDVDMFIIFTFWHIQVAIMTYGVIIFTVTAKFLQ